MTEPITIIGSNTVVSGNLEGDEDLTVEGRVEGSINLSKTLTVEVGGVVRANINVRNAIVSGVLVGNVEAQEFVQVTEQGRVVGDIAAPRVILVDGASFRGSIDMGDFDTERDLEGVGSASRAPSVPYEAEEKEEKIQAKIEERPAPTRVRRVTASAAPARKVPPRPVPSRPVVTKKAPPAVSSAKKKKPPAPKVRSVGKSKAVKKKRA